MKGKRASEAEEPGEKLEGRQEADRQTGEVGSDRDPRLTLSGRVQSLRLWV